MWLLLTVFGLPLARVRLRARRLIALMALLPIVILTLVDVLGWLTFKLILRPLGYTST